MWCHKQQLNLLHHKRGLIVFQARTVLVLQQLSSTWDNTLTDHKVHTDSRIPSDHHFIQSCVYLGKDREETPVTETYSSEMIRELALDLTLLCGVLLPCMELG